MSHTHLRPFMPPPALRAKEFTCILCDRTCDPTKEQWTSLEFVPIDEMRIPWKWSKYAHATTRRTHD